jgi:hypothetical protein
VTAIPTTAVAYDIAMTGTSYSGNTGFLAYGTSFSPMENFLVRGTMVVTPTISALAGFNNGVNPHDVAFNTGNIVAGGAGVMQFATNSTLHQLYGGSFAQASSLDVAYVSSNEQTGRLVIDIDSTNARTVQLNTMSNTLTSVGQSHQIVAGRMIIDFANGGTTVTGSLDFYGEGYDFGGTSRIVASFSGRMRA